MGISFYTPTYMHTYMQCKRCGSTDTTKAGIHYKTSGKYQRYRCKNCGHLFVGESVGEAKLRTEQK